MKGSETAGRCRVLVACSALTLAPLSSLAAGLGTPQLAANQTFKSINQSNIESVRNEINGSANEQNLIPTGTVLVYKTSAGNLGKMQILKYGYNLRFRFITYRRDGGILVRRDNALVKGTYLYDLDRGRSPNGGTTADLFWEQADNVHRYLVFGKRSSFTIVRTARAHG
jgi:hypothetical protein